MLSVLQLPEILTQTNAQDILEICTNHGYPNILQVGEELIQAQSSPPGIYLLVVVYASGIVGLYIGKSMRSIASRILSHRNHFLHNTAPLRLVYSGSPIKVLAVPLMEFPDLRAMYAQLPEGRMEMTPRQLCNSFGSLCEMTLIALFGTCNGSQKYRELLAEHHSHAIASMRGLNTQMALSGDFSLVAGENHQDIVHATDFAALNTGISILSSPQREENAPSFGCSW